VNGFSVVGEEFVDELARLRDVGSSGVGEADALRVSVIVASTGLWDEEVALRADGGVRIRGS
jgi:hypothetical protein